MEAVRHRAVVIAWAIAAFIAVPTHAQEMPLDGSRPPVIPISDAVRADEQMPVEPDSAVALPAPATPAAGGAIAGVLSRGAESAPRRTFRPPPAAVSLEPGKNATYGIAKDHINRIVTPFGKPSIRTTSTASTSIEGSIVYLATPIDTPVSLFIFDEAAPEFAISLTLVPQDDIPPVSTTVTVAGWSGTAASQRRPGSTAQALAREGQHPYLETLTTVLRDVAKGQVPDGYGYEPIGERGVAGMPSCQIPGIHVQPMQLLVGGSFKVIVAKATNTSYGPADIREDQCQGRELRAVAAWPLTRLSPGQATELYLVVGAYSDPFEAPTRPSVLGGN